jgi:hypothetical protein
LEGWIEPRSSPVRARPGLLRSLGREEDGFVLVFFAVAIPALLGLVGLALDGVRLMTFDTELANRADAAALAAASRLNRTEGAILAAREAARVAASGPGRDAVGLVFRFAGSLAELEASPTFSLADEAGADAAVVEVRTEAATLIASLLRLSVRAQSRSAAERRPSPSITPATSLRLRFASRTRAASRARPGQARNTCCVSMVTSSPDPSRCSTARTRPMGARRWSRSRAIARHSATPIGSDAARTSPRTSSTRR